MSIRPARAADAGAVVAIVAQLGYEVGPGQLAARLDELGRDDL